MTADDVVFTATWAAQNASAFQGFPSNWVEIEGAADLDGTTNPLTGIVANDPQTVQITLANPNVDFIRLRRLLERHLAEARVRGHHRCHDRAVRSGDQVARRIGPYMLTNFQPDQFAEFEANPNYFGGKPKIDKIAWKVLNSAQILSQLQTGELDFAMKVNAKDQALLASNPDLEFPTTTDVGMYGLFLRTDHPVLDDPKIRQAMYYAIDRQAIIDGILNGQASLLWNPPG